MNKKIITTGNKLMPIGFCSQCKHFKKKFFVGFYCKKEGRLLRGDMTMYPVADIFMGFPEWCPLEWQKAKNKKEV